MPELAKVRLEKNTRVQSTPGWECWEPGEVVLLLLGAGCALLLLVIVVELDVHLGLLGAGKLLMLESTACLPEEVEPISLGNQCKQVCVDVLEEAVSLPSSSCTSPPSSLPQYLLPSSHTTTISLPHRLSSCCAALTGRNKTLCLRPLASGTHHSREVCVLCCAVCCCVLVLSALREL